HMSSFVLVFFFSSRRRHTRFKCDWSSDVCSSDLREGSRVLDAPCGYGRLSLPLARRGAIVVGVDQSAELLAQAEKDRGDLPANRSEERRVGKECGCGWWREYGGGEE